MKHHVYNTFGTCSEQIEFDLDDQRRLHNVVFHGGCHGNTQGVSRLVEGMEADEAVSRLEGILCKSKPTSCPDQLARAIKEAVAG
ncbi:MAG: TIGR03905 family TSCPD domain-containing protein [Bacteroidales bacterium]|nr:TIGR03905 family TSCPD domain-containing protein [Bacteroidales bacterium]